jgi:molybdate-binding protein/DNA-binding XRE family transcriptional regulator
MCSVSEPGLDNAVRRHREEAGLSQQALAELADVSRQAIVAIEGGRQVPSTALSLRLARALRCGVEDLFSLSVGAGIAARLAPDDERSPRGARVALAEIDGKWAAHRLPLDAVAAADGLVTALVSPRTALVTPLTDPAQLRRNVLVTGCAPILSALSQRVGGRFADARATWLPTSSRTSLDLLHQGLVHVAGIHLPGGRLGEDNISTVRRRFAGEAMVLVNLTRWRQGFVVPPGNPLAIRSGADLLRRGLKLAHREDGSGAHTVVRRLLSEQGADQARLPGPLAGGHAEVAQLVRCGAADVGVAIESVALAAGLGFVPLAEERFDLVVRAHIAETGPVSRFLEMLDDASFRTEMAELPGYDGELAGHATTLDAA